MWYVEHCNNVRLHSTIGYIAPAGKLTGRDEEIFKKRDRKLEEGRELRRMKLQHVTACFDQSGTVGIPLTQTA
jgi:hypothetical protein